ncbi:hypothetical protein [Nocardioides sp.]|uniref:hypothetical protein n=1 Tax=Nocardioides sp. TaxID=35761 RepID=UPI002B26BF02|nr:hypothetical protein [Nocardioides sp.]
MRSLLTRRRSRLLLGGVVALAVALGPGVTPVSVAAAAVDPPTPIKVIQNYGETVEEFSSATCYPGPNTWFRRFDLASDHGSSSGFRLESIVVGHQEVVPNSESIEIGLGAYTIDPGEELLEENLDPLAGTSFMLGSDQEYSITSTPLAATVPAGKHLVIAVMNSGSDGIYYIGGNQQPQSASAYLLAPGCDLFVPTPTDTFVEGSLLFYAVGTSQDCLSATAAVEAAEQAAAVAKAKYKKTHKKYKKAKKALKKAKKKGSRSTYKKAKRKYKKAKKAYKKARSAYSSAQSALVSAQQTATTECAQPSLPAPRAGDGA